MKEAPRKKIDPDDIIDFILITAIAGATESITLFECGAGL